MKPFVITGCGRSGTMGVAKLLNAVGVRASFEEFFGGRPVENSVEFLEWLRSTKTHGEVSGLSAPCLGRMKGASKLVILHQVRNPIAVIASLMGELTWTDKRWWPNVKYNFRHLPTLGPRDDPLTLSIKYWMEWNRLIDRTNPTFRYRVEDMPATLDKILHIIRATPTKGNLFAGLESYHVNHNHGQRDMSISWARIPASELKEQLLEKALGYGYTVGELESFCPIGPSCPHCHP